MGVCSAKAVVVQGPTVCIFFGVDENVPQLVLGYPNFDIIT